MTEQLTKGLSLKAAYEFGAAHGLEREVNEIRDMVIEWISLTRHHFGGATLSNYSRGADC